MGADARAYIARFASHLILEFIAPVAYRNENLSGAYLLDFEAQPIGP